MCQLNKFNSNLLPVTEFSKNKELEFSIDRKIFTNLIFIKNYYQLTDILNKYINDFNLRKGNDALYRLKEFLRFRWKYVELYDFLSYEERGYLLSVKKFIYDLHLVLNKKIDKHPIDYAIDLIKEKIILGYDINILMETININININNCNLICHKNGCLELYFVNLKTKILVCENENLLDIQDVNNSIIIFIFGSGNPSLEKIKKVTNIVGVYIKIKNKFLYLPVNNPLRSAAHLFLIFNRKIEKSNVKFTPLVSNEIEYLADEFNGFIESQYSWFIDEDIFGKLKELKTRIEKIKNYISFHEFCLDKDFIVSLSLLINYLSIAFNTLKFQADLDSKIDFCLSEIKRSSTLYIKSGAGGNNSDIIFAEENFSSILASNLRCLFYSNKLAQINCEAIVGKGRADIEIRVSKRTLAFIESKMIKQGEDTSKKVGEGLDQLFSRYSENYSINVDPCIRLYLLLFSYDKSFNNLSEKIYIELEAYSKRNLLVHEKIDVKENKLTFLYKEEKINFMDKYRILEIIVCNLEVGYKKKSHDRLKKSDYTLIKK